MNHIHLFLSVCSAPHSPGTGSVSSEKNPLPSLLYNGVLVALILFFLQYLDQPLQHRAVGSTFVDIFWSERRTDCHLYSLYSAASVMKALVFLPENNANVH